LILSCPFSALSSDQMTDFGIESAQVMYNASPGSISPMIFKALSLLFENLACGIFNGVEYPVLQRARFSSLKICPNISASPINTPTFM